MRKSIIIGGAAILAVVAVPFVVHSATKPSGDPLRDTLHGYFFLPITPPSKLMSVGSLYYVDAEARDFKAICHADAADLKDAVVRSSSWEIQESLQRQGRLATSVKADLGTLIEGDVDDDYAQQVDYSLTDIVLEEIPLGASWLIFARLMEKPECNKVAMLHIYAGGYVCQGQKILRATAEFKLDRNAKNKLAAKAKVSTKDINRVVKVAVESQSDHSVIEREGRLFSGEDLHYGVSMNPLCLAPPDGRFQRILPRSTFGRFVNFVKFSIVEPILPAKVDQSQLAQK